MTNLPGKAQAQDHEQLGTTVEHTGKIKGRQHKESDHPIECTATHPSRPTPSAGTGGTAAHAFLSHAPLQILP